MEKYSKKVMAALVNFMLLVWVAFFALTVEAKPAVKKTQVPAHFYRSARFEALIYKGPGSCVEDCSEGAAAVAEMVGLKPVYVGPENNDPKIFEHAAVWIQPGGKSREVAGAMNSHLKERIKKFVYNGGGYVGFCAGGFFSTELISETGVAGLGVLAGKNHLYQEVKNIEGSEMLLMKWGNQFRYVYWEGGPYFILPSIGIQNANGIEILATYPNGAPATVQSNYGAGFVVVTGVHPEAPEWWAPDEHLSDQDGADFDMAIDMIQRASQNSLNNSCW